MIMDMVDKPLLVFAHLEKVVGFFNDLRFGLMVRALSLHQFPIRIKAFAAKAVFAFIFIEINITLVVYFLENFGDHSHVIGIGCANKIIILNIELWPKIFKQCADIINIGAWGDALLFSRPHDFIPMLIRSG